MATYTISINERTIWGRGLVDYLRRIPVNLTLVTKGKKHKTGIDEALEDVKHGRVLQAESVDDMFKQILGDDYVLN